MKLEKLSPMEIERKSMEIIEKELPNTRDFSDEEKLVVKRVIHAAADFEYYNNLKFSENAVLKAKEILKMSPVIVTDTKMALSGISKPAVESLSCKLHCFISDKDVAENAKALSTTRSYAAVDKAAKLFAGEKTIFVVGNAPTALARICELYEIGKLSPSFVIAAPVGFVNVEASKQMIMQTDIPFITADGRKGGSTVAAAICNALLYQVYSREDG